MLSGLMFKELLGLPIPFDPHGIVPDVAVHAYSSLKGAIGGVFAQIKSIFIR